ncbi:MAG: hypothetical protein M2R45_05389 [Verrucomicrobia subdivision 3 bacterium]|nr:hypothetical protein [Limisphaerales bacterium]MCS1415958.1 hypothetical protein [Limisphaerales bacterium]
MAKQHRSYKNLPPLGGICSFEEAAKSGLSIDNCVSRLKRYHYAFKRLHGIFTAHITAEPIYELKMGFSHHAHLCAEHVNAMKTRITEMREPPLGLDKVPNPNLEIFFDEIIGAPTTEERLLGIYGKAIPALQDALQRHLDDTNPLADSPSVRICTFALLEVKEMQAYGQACLDALVDDPTRIKASAWLQNLAQLLADAGDLNGAQKVDPQTVANRCYSKTPYQYDPKPKRDERFPDPYNMGVNAEAFLYDESFAPEPKTLMMFYKRLREIDVPEMMASIIVETPNKPWSYYRDMTRQLWDEARHAMMGEVGFVDLGVDWRKVMVNFTWSLALNTQLTPIERHAVLYYIEQGLMPKTGKRFEWEVAQASKNPLSALFQDYDWADEVLHAKIGRDWYLSEIGAPKKAVDYGDECWSKVLIDWGKWKQDGLTDHRNWWPELYRDACEQWGIKPDDKVLRYHTTYEAIRADLKTISASG